MNCPPSFESSTFASAAVQNAKESFTAATSLSFGSVSAIFTSGAVCPEIFEQNVLFDCAMCITRCPNEFISGDGLNTYFSAGIASAAATMFFSYRPTPAFKNPLTGFATGDRSGGALAAGAACCADALPAAINTAITATSKLARVFIFPSRQNPFESIRPPQLSNKRHRCPAPFPAHAAFLLPFPWKHFRPRPVSTYSYL